MRIIIHGEVQMIDACPIVLFAESRDDTIRNGILLCPNIHRAFDREFIALTNDYEVMVKSCNENDSAFALKQFEVKMILPLNKYYLPDPANLARHRNRHHFN